MLLYVRSGVHAIIAQSLSIAKRLMQPQHSLPCMPLQAHVGAMLFNKMTKTAMYGEYVN